MSGVGTKKVFENDRVIVWEMTLEPGDSTGQHTHEHDYFFRVISDLPWKPLAVMAFHAA